MPGTKGSHGGMKRNGNKKPKKRKPKNRNY